LLGNLGRGKVAVVLALTAHQDKLQLGHGIVEGGGRAQIEAQTKIHEAGDALLTILNGEQTADVVVL